MHEQHFGAKTIADYPTGEMPDGVIGVKNVSGRTLQLGEPVVTLFPGEKAAFCDDAKGLQGAISSKSVKVIFVKDSKEKEEVKESTPKKKKPQAVEESAPEQETVLETVASDAPETSVQLGVVDVESLPSEQQEGN